MFAFNRISEKKGYFNKDLWNSMLSIMETAIKNADRNGGLIVTYEKITKRDGEVAKVEVQPLDISNDIYLIGKDQMKEKRSERIEFVLLFTEVSVSFSLKDLDELTEVRSLDIASVWSQVEMKFKDQGKRNLYAGTGDIKYGKANIHDISGYHKELDNIELSAGVGLGFYRDRFVPDLGFRIAVNMPDRLGKPRLQFGLLYTQHYFFNEVNEGEFNLDINGFLSGFTSLKGIGDYELGLAVGGLIHREGNFYRGKTYKFSVYTQKNESKISFTPELIFTNNFKEIIPAIRFGLSF